MKNIEIDEELYQYIAKNTQFIGESASSILRRLLSLENSPTNTVASSQENVQQEAPKTLQQDKPVVSANNKVAVKTETQTKKTTE